jgi:hypothetical protein
LTLSGEEGGKPPHTQNFPTLSQKKGHSTPSSRSTLMTTRYTSSTHTHEEFTFHKTRRPLLGHITPTVHRHLRGRTSPTLSNPTPYIWWFARHSRSSEVPRQYLKTLPFGSLYLLDPTVRSGLISGLGQIPHPIDTTTPLPLRGQCPTTHNSHGLWALAQWRGTFPYPLYLQ